MSPTSYQAAPSRVRGCVYYGGDQLLSSLSDCFSTNLLRTPALEEKWPELLEI